MGGVVRPLVLSILAESGYQGLGLGIVHQILTHRSESAASALGVLIPVLNDLLKGAEPARTLSFHARSVRVPQITGDRLFEAYRKHRGPENISKQEMWALHTKLGETPFDVDGLARDRSEREVVQSLFATACYPEHGLPLLLYLAFKHGFDVENCLLANANAGGDNVHRGMILGLIVGAVSGQIPEHLIQGLIARRDLESEIKGFTEIILSGAAV